MNQKYDESILSEYAKDEKNCPDKYRNTVEYFDEDKLIINHCDVVLTEKCTLRCKDCANLMQYYVHPENIDLQIILRSLNNLIESVDAVLDVRLIGGEPFIYNKIDDVISFLCTSKKIKRISIYTNSTLVPDDKTIRIMKNKKVFVHMSDYGIISRNRDLLEQRLKENNINHYIHKYEMWNDVGNLDERKYTSEQAGKIYSKCIMAKCYTLYEGRLFLCPRSAHGEKLGIYKNADCEYVDLIERDTIGLRGEIERIMSNQKPLTACFYCNGSSNDSKFIVAAVQ